MCPLTVDSDLHDKYMHEYLFIYLIYTNLTDVTYRARKKGLYVVW